MNPLHVHTIQSGNLRYNYVKFRNVLDFNSFVEQEPLNHANKEVWKTTVNSASLKLQKRTTWYGTPSPKTLEELANHQQFSGMHLL